MLKKQILEALASNDNDLYTLLKSQWAHRFGVESLEELQKIDENLMNQIPANEDNQEIDQLQDDFIENGQSIFLKEDDQKEKEIPNVTKKVVKSFKVDSQESFKNKSYKILEKENHEKKIINSVGEYKNPPEVKALIPLPPKPKYSYLKKWLLRSKF